MFGDAEIIIASAVRSTRILSCGETPCQAKERAESFQQLLLQAHQVHADAWQAASWCLLFFFFFVAPARLSDVGRSYTVFGNPTGDQADVMMIPV